MPPKGLRIRPLVPINPNMTVAEIYRCAFFTAGLVLLSGSNCWGQTISAASNGAPHIETKSNVAPRISENALFQKVNDSPSVDVASSAPPQREARTRTPHVKFDVIGAPHVDFDVIEAPHVETKVMERQGYPKMLRLQELLTVQVLTPQALQLHKAKPPLECHM